MKNYIENQINTLLTEFPNEINETVNHAYIIGKIEVYKDMLNKINNTNKQINELLIQAEENYKNTTLTKLTNHIHYGEIQALKKVINIIEKNNQ